MTGQTAIPVWSLEEVFPGFESEEYKRAKDEVKAELETMRSQLSESAPPEKEADFSDWLLALLGRLDHLEMLADTLSAYAYARFSTDTKSPEVLAELNRVEALLVPAATVQVLFRNLLARHGARVRKAIRDDARLKEYAFVLEEALLFQKHQMATELEDLAADLSRSGADAWSRLQESILANASALWNEASGARKTMVELRNLAYDPDRAVREKAYRLELGIWKTYEIPVAAALNGVKGTVSTLNRRRGWGTALDTSLAQARISKATLDALVGVMEESLPLWRRYLRAKARLLGRGRLSFFDIFAPLQQAGAAIPTFGWEEAKAFIVRQFGTFDADMARFASIFSETLVSNAAMAEIEAGSRMPLVELHLQDACQVIVDILSRFYFERAVFSEREEGELTPERLCALMLDAQARTYGDAMREDERHPYMWAVKSHYYRPGLSFYNFPYAFGQLFGMGLYSLYRKEGAPFAARYRELLRATGSQPAVEVAHRAGFDIEKAGFWKGAMAAFEPEIEFLEAQAGH